MKDLKSIILEKLKLDKDYKEPISYNEIYKVKEGDIVLCITFSKKSGNNIYVFLYVGKIINIDNKQFSVENLKTHVEREYNFEDHTHSSPHIGGCFGFVRLGSGGWSAVMNKETAIKTLDRYKSNSRYYFGSYKVEIPKGTKFKYYLESLIDELDFYDK